MNYLAGTDTTVVVPLSLNGEPVVPDNGEVQWELRGHSGEVVSPFSTRAGVTDSSVAIVISSANVTLAGHLREQRTLRVKGLVDGFPFMMEVPFSITDFLNFGATPKDVRKFIGISDGELSDDEIDLVEAYFDLNDNDGVNMATALSGTEKSQRAANKALVAQAVLNLLPGLPQLLSKRETDGTSEVERFTPDFQELEARARGQRDTALDSFRTTTAPEVTLVAVSTRTDPLTGA